MNRSSIWACLLIVCAGAALAIAQASGTPPTTQPADPDKEAADLLSKMDDLLSIEARSRSDFERQVNQHMPTVLATLDEIERKYPNCKDIHEGRMMGLLAASRLARVNHDPAMAAKARALGRKVIDAKNAPPMMKVFADAHLTMMKINPVGGTTTRPSADADTMVRQFVKRYADSDYAVQALKLGMQMAAAIGDRGLFESLRDQLIKKHPEDPDSLQLQREQG